MFDMIGASPICVRADREVQYSICECTLLDNLRRTSEAIEVTQQDFFSDFRAGINRPKTRVSQALERYGPNLTIQSYHIVGLFGFTDALYPESVLEYNHAQFQMFLLYKKPLRESR